MKNENTVSVPEGPILVTGAAGFIGSHLVDALVARGRTVVAVDCLTEDYDPTLKLENLRVFRARYPSGFYPMDLRDSETLEGIFRAHRPVAVFHLAGKCNVRESVRSPQSYFEVNLGATLALLDCCTRYPVERLVFTSTSSIYHTDQAGAPVSPYARSKLEAEQAIERWAATQPGTFCLALRLFSVYGPRLRPDLVFSEFVRKLLLNQTMDIFGDGRQARDFTHVADVITSLIRGLERALPPGLRNFATLDIGRGQPERLDHALELISNRLGYTPRFRYLERNPVESLSLHADGQDAERLLGFRPGINLAQGLDSFLDWRVP